ncbi:MAG: phytanoyl-CoA dioxygenase family protein [Gammaproteobacteria bacterium]|nr:phytanoyl-CoA dioxygenase family protein [Gammaproteobacteria bacterium]
MQALSPEQCTFFARNGYLVLPDWVEAGRREAMLAAIQRELQAEAGPLEYEADVDYPGSPKGRGAEGGRTVRRLLQAGARSPVFQAWFEDARLLAALNQVLGGEVKQARAHHNCVMTKHPRYSSDTGWHQDMRYWSFERPELVSVWLALGREFPENGGLRVIPGTHVMGFSPERYDERLFLRPERADNAALIAQAVHVNLNPGDVLFFHARLFHAASRNHTGETKYSVVATYRPADNHPLPGTRSALND